LCSRDLDWSGQLTSTLNKSQKSEFALENVHIDGNGHIFGDGTNEKFGYFSLDGDYSLKNGTVDFKMDFVDFVLNCNGVLQGNEITGSWERSMQVGDFFEMMTDVFVLKANPGLKTKAKENCQKNSYGGFKMVCDEKVVDWRSFLGDL
jgi:hypothetical protein